MNEIAQSAARALTAPGFPTHNGLCQMWVRKVIQSTSIGHKYDKWLWQETAKEAGEALETLPFGYKHSEVTSVQPGDVLYKTTGSGGAGHVGIVIPDLRVAENSSVHWNETGGKDARGIRTLSAFGNYDVLVRFPLAADKPQASTPNAALILATKGKDGALTYHRLQSAQLQDGRFTVDSTDVIAALMGGNQRVEIRAFLEKLQAAPYDEGNYLSDPQEPRQYLFVDTK